MAHFTINSRIAGPVTFTVPDDGGYVRVFNDVLRCDGRQICQRGYFRGATIMSDAKGLEKAARAWWRQYLRVQGEFA